MKNVLIADDHPIFRAGLRLSVEEEGYHVVAEAGDGKTCISSAEISRPDFIILDLAMPRMDGYEVLDWLGKNLPKTVAIVVSMHSSRVFALKAKTLGARAFVAKEDAATEISHALSTPAGIFYLSASVGAEQNLGIVLEQPETLVPDLEILTKAERRIFRMVGQSRTSRQIAQELNLSHRTVQTHRANISRKLELSGPNKLLEVAIRNAGRGPSDSSDRS